MFNPHKRISAVDALDHPYLEEVRDRSTEPVAGHVLDPSEFVAVER